ncbi:MAG: type ISP restriction/modification enzyme, partial [Pyrinomonadaceae bacterium]
SECRGGGQRSVRHAHLWGVRELYEENEAGERVLTGGKYHWLWQNNLSTTEWRTIEPQLPFYFFMPQDTNLKEEYERGWELPKAFPVNNTGIITARDKFVRGFTVDEVHKRITDFSNLDFGEAKEKYGLGNVRERTLQESWRMVRGITDIKKFIHPMLRQPFDLRPLFYHEALVRWPVYAIMRHMIAGNNKGLITTRVTKDIWDSFACNSLMGHKALASYDVNYLFPLHVYPDQDKTNLFDNDNSTDVPGGRRPNLAPEFVADFSARLKLTFISDCKGDLMKSFGPEDVFHYMYAVFHAPAYRSRYAEFLKIDFPRLPLTSNVELFRALCRHGEELTGLHLMDQHAPLLTSYPVPGHNTVEKVEYKESERRVWINKQQYFEGVPPEVWGFHVGGYRVANKWLKDRKGRQLTYDDLTHYQHVVSALGRTIELMGEIDEVLAAHGGWPVS